ncbi:MAG: type II secretion system F family protein [Candidatus Aenigmarchaeota archaeon]|nr:type II secretion system F family protein [Candidatus Aenigmarchaeota archaeon]
MAEDFRSREYKLFLEARERKPETFYEKTCAFSEKLLGKVVDEKSGKKMQKAIDFSHLKLTPNGVMAFTILFTLVIAIPATILFVLRSLFSYTIAAAGESSLNSCIKGTYDAVSRTCNAAYPGLDVGMYIFVIAVTIPIAFYIYIYPYHLRKKYEMDAGSEIVNAILYMVSYMRNTPSLEGAVDFAARNLTGPLVEDLRKLMWDVRIGNYLSINEALLDYAEKWERNKEFVESLELLISSLKQTGTRRTKTLDEAIRIVLDGNRESARGYVQQLKMPITIIHAMGIILPVMGLVLFPIIAIFLKVDPIMLFLVYDVMLPLILFFVISNTLEKRPATFSRIDISDHPGLPPEGRIFISKKTVNPFYIGLIIGIVIIILGLFMYVGETSSVGAGEFRQAEGVVPAIVVIFGIAIIPAIQNILLSMKRTEIRDHVRTIESEFREALFQLGNVIGTGVPIERAVDESLKRIEGLKIKKLFENISQNMKRFGMTFENAIFNDKSGAIIYFPSRMIKSILKAVSESSRRGVGVAASSMISISRYLRGIHRTQEQVKDSLNEVASSLRFQAYMLSPLIAGIISTMAIIMIDILKSLAIKAPSMGAAVGTGFFGISSENMGVSPFQFILIVGVYLIESLILLSYLMNGIENGEDPIGRQQLTGYVLIIGVVVFTATVFITMTMFTPLISSVV